jgi:hypothetical protein
VRLRIFVNGERRRSIKFKGCRFKAWQSNGHGGDCELHLDDRPLPRPKKRKEKKL